MPPKFQSAELEDVKDEFKEFEVEFREFRRDIEEKLSDLMELQIQNATTLAHIKDDLITVKKQGETVAVQGVKLDALDRSYSAGKKWVLGIIGGVAVALIVSRFGLK
jgi:hypothetical protein